MLNSFSSPKGGSSRSDSVSTPFKPGAVAVQTPVASRQLGASSSSSSSSSSYAPVRPQLDLITALIPLLRDENRGHSAREAVILFLLFTLENKIPSILICDFYANRF